MTGKYLDVGILVQHGCRKGERNNVLCLLRDTGILEEEMAFRDDSLNIFFLNHGPYSVGHNYQGCRLNDVDYSLPHEIVNRACSLLYTSVYILSVI